MLESSAPQIFMVRVFYTIQRETLSIMASGEEEKCMIAEKSLILFFLYSIKNDCVFFYTLKMN